MKLKLSIFITILLLIITSCDNPSDSPIDELELRGRIGQMIMVGFRGIELTADNPIIGDIENNNICGVVLYDKDVALGYSERNIRSYDQVKTLITSLQSYGNGQLLVSIDQEGGRVRRLKEEYGFPATVSQEYLGTLDNEDSTRYYANRTASLLAELGINLNFAPVVDLNVNPESPAIGKIERSFSRDANIVVKHSQYVIDEHRKSNVLNAIKHFPGHGSAAEDSHIGFTDVTNTWIEEELLPYQIMIENNNVDMVMTSHVYNEHLDPQYPATLSSNTLNILRETYGFDGVIITDDMNMGAIRDNYGLETAIEKSINAGVDILLFANNLVFDENIVTKSIDIILELVSEGKIEVSRINESYERIIQLKGKILQ